MNEILDDSGNQIAHCTKVCIVFMQILCLEKINETTEL